MDSQNTSPTPILDTFFAVPQSQLDLQWFELIFFALTIPILMTNYRSHRQTSGGLLGWLFLWNYSTIRAVGYILLKVGGSKELIIAGNILSSASTSALFLATAGIWHEVAHRHKNAHPLLYGWCMQILIHLAVVGSIGLVLGGTITLYLSNGPIPSYSRPLILVGVIFFMLNWLGLCLLFASLWRIPGKTILEKRLLKALAIALPLLGLRTLYGLCGAAINNSTWSYARGGPLAAEVCLQVLPDCLMILTYAIAGFVTRGIVEERRHANGHAHPAYNREFSQQGDENVIQTSENVYRKA